MSEVVDALARDGFAVVRGLLGPDEVEQVQAAFDRLLDRARRLPDDATPGGAHFVRQHHPFRLHRVVWCGGAEPVLARYGADPRFLSIAAEVLGSRQLVQLIQQAHYKLPGDGVDFAWHQDASNRRYGKLFDDVGGNGSFVQMALAVDPMTPSNGPLRMIPGTHRLGFVADPDTGAVPAEHLQLHRAVDVQLQPGDLAVFGPFVLHGSPPNRSDRPRRLFLQGYALPGANRRVYPGAGLGVERRAPGLD
jgi:ectoine hydroxylase-related dioxygenase (phytanoyl-CoA dioxygenase family)